MALFNWMFMRVESLVPVYGFGIAAGVMLLWGQPWRLQQASA